MSYERTPEIRQKQRKAMLLRKKLGLQSHGWKWSDESKKRLSAVAKQRIGELNPFFGKTHSEESKAAMSQTRTGGLILTPEERAERKAAHTREWLATHPEKVKEYDQKYLEPRASNNRQRRRKLREEVVLDLGGRCSSKTCRWIAALVSFSRA